MEQRPNDICLKEKFVLIDCVEPVRLEVINITKQEIVYKRIDLNPNFTLLSEFSGWRENITRKCNVCGDVRTIKARNLIEKKNGKPRGCIVCVARERASSKRKSHNQFIEELASVNSKIEVLSEYTTTSNKIRCRCSVDNFEWYTTPHSLLDGHGCPECKKRLQNWRTEDQFLSEMKEKHPTITPITHFTRVNDSMEFKCNICNYVWKTAPNILLNKRGYGCPKCNGYAPITEQEMIDRLKKCNPRIKYIGGYKGIIPHANFKCLSCGHEWHTPPNSVLHGRGCPICNVSHGALRIKKILDSLDIKYELEHRFNDCKDIRSLPFDFYIPSKNICIEYDGEQHFMPVKFGKSQTKEQMQEKFDLQLRRDKIKTAYCSDKNILLIRIPYTEFNNIDKILNKYLS